MRFGQIEVFDEVVPLEMYKDLLRLVPHIGWRYGWSSTNLDARYWHHEIAGGAKENTQDVSEVVRRHPVKVFGQYVDWVRREILQGEAPLLRLYFNGHTYGTDGSIHTDTDREGETTLVLFLNLDWKADFGGETVVFDEAGFEIERTILPKDNRLVAFPADRRHGPRPLSRVFPGLRVVLVSKFGPLG